MDWTKSFQASANMRSLTKAQIGMFMATAEVNGIPDKKITGSKQEQNLPERPATRLQEQADLLDLVRDTVIARRMDGTINFWNRSAEEMYGWRKEEAIGRVSHNLLQTQFPESLEEIESELIRKGRWEGKLVHTKRNGERVVVVSRWTLQRVEHSEAVLEINTISSGKLSRTFADS